LRSVRRTATSCSAHSRRKPALAACNARTRDRLAEALPAMELKLTTDDLAEIEKAVPPGAARGDRYPAAFMSGLGVR
jgi:diketogulonate reductase-like aldo/keto reductase